MLASVTARDDVEAFNAECATAISLPSPEQLVSMYTDDAVMISRSRVTAGRDALLERFRTSLTEPTNTAFESRHVIEDGNVVVDVGAILRDGVPVARYVGIHCRQADGRLKMFVDVPLPLG